MGEDNEMVKCLLGNILSVTRLPNEMVQITLLEYREGIPLLAQLLPIEATHVLVTADTPICIIEMTEFDFTKEIVPLAGSPREAVVFFKNIIREMGTLH